MFDVSDASATTQCHELVSRSLRVNGDRVTRPVVACRLGGPQACLRLLPLSPFLPPSPLLPRCDLPPIILRVWKCPLSNYRVISMLKVTASCMRHASLLSLAWFWCCWIVGARCRSLRGVWPHLFLKWQIDWDASTPLTPSAAEMLAVKQSNRHREANTEENPQEAYCTHVQWKQSHAPSSCFPF